MKLVLLDSSVWVSHFNELDSHHHSAVTIVEELVQEEALIVLPEVVVAEVTNVLIRLSPEAELLWKFQQFQKDYDRLVGFVIGNREFWTKTIEQVAHRVQLKTLDLIIVSYAYHFQVDDFKSFDTQQEKAARKVLKR